MTDGKKSKTGSAKLSFKDALLTEIAESPGGVNRKCAICESSNRAEIELAQAEGVKFITIGRALQRLGEMPQNLSRGTIGDRVSTHFRVHMETENAN